MVIIFLNNHKTKMGVLMSECFNNNINSVDQYIYHYTTLQKGLEYILKDMKLRLSPLSEVNDPREYQILHPYFPDFDNYAEDDNSEPLQKIYEIRDYFNKFRNNHKVLCFSRDSEKLFNVPEHYKRIYRGFNKPTLWSHYADNHKGLCLIFDRDKLLESLNNNFGSKKEYNVYKDNHVSYQSLENHIEKMGIRYKDILNYGLPKVLDDFIECNLSNLLFTKTLDWEVENEFRILVCDNSNEKYLYLPINDSLCGIVMGTKLPSVYWGSIKEFNIPYAQLEWKNGLPFLKNVFPPMR
jgi:hypothetical protein